jgi:hypothetical protein
MSAVMPDEPDTTEKGLSAQLTAALNAPDEREQALALAQLAPQLPVDLLLSALTSVHAMTSSRWRTRALLAIVPHLPSTELYRAIDIAHSMSDDSRRAEALQEIANYLPEDRRREALNEAWTAALAIRDENRRATLLAALAPNAPSDALVLAWQSITSIKNRLDVAISLLPYLIEGDSRKVLDQTLADIRSVSNPVRQAQLLASILPHLLEPERSRVLRDALVALAKHGEPAQRVRGLVTLVPQLPETDRLPVLMDALAATRSVPNNRVRASLLTELLKYLPDGMQEDVRQERARIRAASVQGVEPQPEPTSPIAGYKSDDPRGEDLLGITEEVQALCAVLAAKDVEPPLALGLFGQWGSGKSFFMKQMQAYIEELQEAAQQAEGDTPFSTNIVQLKFNAWHYIDVDLWATLAHEIFAELASALARMALPKEEAADSDYKRAQLLADTATSRGELVVAERDKSEAEARLRESEQRLRDFDHDEETIASLLSPRAILRDTYSVVIRQPEVRDQVQQAADDLATRLKRAAAELELPADTLSTDVQEQLLALRGLQGRMHAAWLSLHEMWHDRARRGRWLKTRLIPVVTTLTLATIILAGLWWAGARGIYKALASSLVGVASVAGLLLTLKPYFDQARRALNIVEDARRANQERIDQAKQTRVAQLELDRRHSQELVDAAQKRVDDASTKVRRLEEQLQRLQADRQMTDFIRLRHESTDYASRLGVIARARADFEQLSTLLARVREQAEREQAERRARRAAGQPDDQVQQVESGGEKSYLPRIDRIILYIDDLDRCPESKVVEVLQAIHLLLAFPLFVVVVAVDPRWLLHSLRQHSQAFRQAESIDDDWQSTPLNYLEKIFQIPYTLRPMEPHGFDELIDDLTTQQGVERSGQTSVTIGSVEAEPAPFTGPAPSSSDATRLGAGSPPTARAIPPISASPGRWDIDLNAEHLRIEDWERAFMKELYPFIPSPREAKRFVNIYRLLRASADDDKRDAFVGDAAQGQYQAALLLLALLTGYPAEATEILRSLLDGECTGTWWEHIDSLKEKYLAQTDAAMHVSVSAVNTQMGHWPDLMEMLHGDIRRLIPADRSCEDFVEWAPEVARYSFQSGWTLLAARTARTPAESVQLRDSS